VHDASGYIEDVLTPAIEATERPFPSDEITPPVTKMHFGRCCPPNPLFSRIGVSRHL
jgi:hypothetical protein